MHGVFLLFTRVGGWQVRTPERDLHIDLLSLLLLSRDWWTVHIYRDLCVNSFSWSMPFDMYSLLWKVDDAAVLCTTGVEGKVSMVMPAQTLKIESYQCLVLPKQVPEETLSIWGKSIIMWSL